MIPAGIITMARGSIVPQLMALTNISLDPNIKMVDNGSGVFNSIEYIQNPGGFGKASLYIEPGKPFELHWDARPQVNSSGANVWISEDYNADYLPTYLGSYLSTSSGLIQVWFSTTYDNESSVTPASSPNIYLRYRGDGTTIYREYSLNNTTWTEVASSYRVAQNKVLYIIFDLRESNSAKLGTRLNNILYKGLVDMYINEAKGMGLSTYGGYSIPMDSLGFYATNDEIGGTVKDKILYVGDSFGCKIDPATNISLQVAKYNNFPVLWENAVGISIVGNTLTESFDWGAEGVIGLNIPLPPQGWVFFKRETANTFTVYTFETPSSDGVLVYTITTNDTEYQYPYFTFWYQENCKVKYPQFLESQEFETQQLTINVSGVEDYRIFINNVEYATNVVNLRKDSVNTVRIEKSGYVFIPASHTVTMNSDKTISFIAEAPSEDTIYIGSGSGNLSINSDNVASYIRTVVINPGTYSQISITNLNRENNPVTIKNGGTVKTSYLYIENVNGASLKGNGVESLPLGIQLHDIGYRAVELKGTFSNLSLEHISFKNIGDYTMFKSTTLNYVGTAASRHDNFKILNCKFDKCGTIMLGGGLDSSSDRNLYTNLEFAFNTCINSSNWGSVMECQNVANYSIHDNVVDNFAQTLAIHNGVFWMRGAGKFYNNKATNYSGNMIRAWAYDRLEFPCQIEIYNNIGYNSWRYGLFEIQGFPDTLVAGKTIESNNNVVSRNTGGLLDTSNNWEGTIVDIYNWIGNTNVINNLGFQMHKANGGAPTDSTLINGQGGPFTQSGNRYFASQSNAVEDVINFKSKIPGVGAGELP